MSINIDSKSLLSPTNNNSIIYKDLDFKDSKDIKEFKEFKSINNIDMNQIDDIKSINSIKSNSIENDSSITKLEPISNSSSFINLNHDHSPFEEINIIPKTSSSSNLLINQLIDLNNRRINNNSINCNSIESELNDNQFEVVEKYNRDDLVLDDNLNFLSNHLNNSVDAHFSPITNAKLEKDNLENNAITPIFKNKNNSNSNSAFFNSEIHDLYSSNDNFSKVALRRSVSNNRVPTPLFESKLKVARARYADPPI